MDDSTMSQCVRLLTECSPPLHRWRTYTGDRVPPSFFNGARCYCGEKRIVLHRCDCGHEHLTAEPAEPKAEPLDFEIPLIPQGSFTTKAVKGQLPLPDWDY